LPASSIHINIWAAGTLVFIIIRTIWPSTTSSVCQNLYNLSQLLLEDFDTLFDYLIGFKIASALNFEIELPRLSIVVKGLAFLWWIFPLGVFARGPSKMSVMNNRVFFAQNLPFS
jgi:hypothetical protein